LRDAADDPRDSGKQSGTIGTSTELGRHVLAAGFTREPVGDELLEVVPDFDPDLAILPWFSNFFTAYSRMSPYGLNVGIVATMTTSPLAV
jgi:hypothetical protein